MEYLIKLGISALVFGIIEWVDGAFLDFNIPWVLSLLIALVIVFGGFLVFVDGDLDFF